MDAAGTFKASRDLMVQGLAGISASPVEAFVQAQTGGSPLSEVTVRGKARGDLVLNTVCEIAGFLTE